VRSIRIVFDDDGRSNRHHIARETPEVVDAKDQNVAGSEKLDFMPQYVYVRRNENRPQDVA
jgi:hypothetical protein